MKIEIYNEDVTFGLSENQGYAKKSLPYIFLIWTSNSEQEIYLTEEQYQQLKEKVK